MDKGATVLENVLYSKVIQGVSIKVIALDVSSVSISIKNKFFDFTKTFKNYQKTAMTQFLSESLSEIYEIDSITAYLGGVLPMKIKESDIVQITPLNNLGEISINITYGDEVVNLEFGIGLIDLIDISEEPILSDYDCSDVCNLIEELKYVA